MKRAAFIAVLAFAVGVIVRDVAQDWRDKARAEALVAQVRACPQYVVVDQQGQLACRALMPRFDIYMPVKPAMKKEPM